LRRKQTAELVDIKAFQAHTVKIRGSFQPKKAGYIHPKTWGILVEKPGYLSKWSFYPNWGISPTYPMNSGVFIVGFQPSLPQIFVRMTPEVTWPVASRGNLPSCPPGTPWNCGALFPAKFQNAVISGSMHEICECDNREKSSP